jgi:hypothetical protein
MVRRLGLKLLDLDAARGRARELVQLHRPAIETVAAELLRRMVTCPVFASGPPRPRPPAGKNERRAGFRGGARRSTGYRPFGGAAPAAWRCWRRCDAPRRAVF